MSETNLKNLSKDELIARLEAAEAAAKPAEPVVNNDPHRRVKITLSLGRGDQLYEHVSVNDYNAVIRRGEEVEVPYFVAKHLQEMKEQDRRTTLMIRGLSDEWDAKKL